MNIKKEASFVVRTYLSNIFTIWSLCLLGTSVVSFIPLVDAFRTALWVNQIFWLFLAPFLVFVGIEMFRKYETLPRGVSKKAVIVGLIIGIGTGAILVDYAFFTSGIIMVIAQQHPETKKDPVEYDKLEKTIQFGEFFALPLVNVTQLRIRKKFVDNGDIVAKEFGNKTKVISIGISFLIALTWVIYYNNANSLWNFKG